MAEAILSQKELKELIECAVRLPASKIASIYHILSNKCYKRCEPKCPQKLPPLKHILALSTIQHGSKRSLFQSYINLKSEIFIRVTLYNLEDTYVCLCNTKPAPYADLT